MAGEEKHNGEHLEVQVPFSERVLRRLGLGRLARIAPGDWNALVWFAICVILFETVLLQAYNVTTGRVIGFVENPLRTVPLLIILGTAVAVQWLQKEYQKAIHRSLLVKRCENPSKFREFVPDWLVIILIVLGTGFTVTNALVILTIPTLYEIGGPARVIRFLLIVPFGYVPILATGIATYLTAEVLLPRRLEQSTVSLDYLDPENLGGMRPIGEFLKISYYVAMIGLIAYAFGIYGPHLVEGPLNYEEIPKPGQVANILFTAVWFVAVVTMVYGIYVMHRFMSSTKKKDLQKLRKQMPDQHASSASIENLNVVDPSKELEAYRKKTEMIASTREYPAKFTMWVQFLIGVFLPKAIQMVLSGTV